MASSVVEIPISSLLVEVVEDSKFTVVVTVSIVAEVSESVVEELGFVEASDVVILDEVVVVVVVVVVAVVVVVVVVVVDVVVVVVVVVVVEVVMKGGAGLLRTPAAISTKTFSLKSLIIFIPPIDMGLNSNIISNTNVDRGI